MALDPAEGAALACLAAATVGARLAGLPALDESPPSGEGVPAALATGESVSGALAEPGACFVTLEVNGRLRGCVGTIEPARPLYLDAIRNAQRAMRDPRMPALAAAEWPYLDVKVSVVSDGGSLPAGGRSELLAALRPGVDGLLITDGTRRATFLPAVWAKLRDPEEFVEALLAKGGWPANAWPDALVASRYTTSDYRDGPPRPTLAAVAAVAASGGTLIPAPGTPPP
jgi:AmmeMemoRadiSam system protein A